jgi:hypothetical protein
MEKQYPKPIAGEKKWVDYDDESAMWGVFGEESGYCYSTWSDEETANKHSLES